MTSDPYKTFLSPLHRELINRALHLAWTVEDHLGEEDRERAKEALGAVRALLEGEGTREAVAVAEKRIRAAASKWDRKAGKEPWAEPFRAVLLVAAVARLANAEYPKTQAQTFEQCLSLWRKR